VLYLLMYVSTWMSSPAASCMHIDMYVGYTQSTMTSGRENARKSNDNGTEHNSGSIDGSGAE